MSLAKFSSEERRWVFSYALFLIVLTSIPYALAFASQGGEWVFSGFLIGVEDGNSYIANMLTGAQGAWLFRSPYSAMEQQGALLFLPYLLLGKLLGSSATHLAMVVAYHLFRVLAIGALSFPLYNFFALYIHDLSLRRMALVLATLGGGLGWIALALGQLNWLGSLPLDFYSPESFGFLAIFALPHLTLARALLFWGLVKYLRNDTIEFRHIGLKIAALWLTLALVHVLVAVIGLILISAHLALMALWKTRQNAPIAVREKWESHFSNVLWAAGGAALPLSYNAWVYLTDPFIQIWAAQNLLPSPHPFHYLLAYGLLLPMIYFGAEHLLKKEYWQASFPVLWIALLPLMVYSPFGMQRRFADGVWVAFLVLALVSFESKTFADRQRWQLLFAALLPSTAIIFYGTMQIAINPQQPAFRPAEEVAVFEVLKGSTSQGDLIMSSFQTGNAIPAWVPLRVMIGHGPLSAGLSELSPRIANFYGTASSNEERNALIREFGVAYVFWGPAERNLGDWQPDEMRELTLLFQGGAYSIYQYTEN